MGASKAYFIKEDYRENPIANRVDDPEAYWTDERIQLSREYQYHVYQYARDVFLERQMTSILDVGSGPAKKLNHFFAPLTDDIVVMDRPGLASVIDRTFPGVRYHEVDLEQGHFVADRRFDLVLCVDVIEHLNSPDKLLQLIAAHMERTGCAIISTPDRDMRRGENNKQSPNPEHVREWNCCEFEKYLVYHGFTINAHFNMPAKRLSRPLFWLSRKFFYRRIRKSDWYACQVALVTR